MISKNNFRNTGLIIFSLFPILSFYSFIPLLHFGYLIILIYCIIYLFCNKFRINTPLAITITILLFINILNGITYGFNQGVANNTIGMLVFLVISLGVSSLKFDIEKVFIYIKIIGLIVSVLLILQFVLFYFYDYALVLKLPFLTLRYPEYALNWSIYSGRPNSLFMEPAHFALFILPIFYLSLKRNTKLTSLILFVSLFLSTSTLGIVVAIFIIISHYIYNFKFNRNFMFGFVSIIIGILIALNLNIIQDYVVDKLTIEYFANSMRIFRPITYFKEIDNVSLVFGIGLNQMEEYFLTNFNIITHNYSNTYFFTIFSFGIIGLLVWLFFMYSLYKNINKKYIGLFIVFLVIQFTDQLLFNTFLIYYIALIVFSSNKNTIQYSSV